MTIADHYAVWKTKARRN